MLVRHIILYVYTCVIFICVYIYIINNVQRILNMHIQFNITLILMREFKLEFQFNILLMIYIIAF